MRALTALFALALMLASPLSAQTAPEPSMSMDRMARILTALDPEVARDGPYFQLTLGDVPVVIVTDATANRMRAMVPIRAASGLDPEELMRLMQANFDTALDARYAVARGRLWAVFIHPLSELERDQLISGLGQTVNLALSYGTLYTGGALTFGGGDSQDLHRQLIEDLLRKGQDI